MLLSCCIPILEFRQNSLRVTWPQDLELKLNREALKTEPPSPHLTRKTTCSPPSTPISVLLHASQISIDPTAEFTAQSPHSFPTFFPTHNSIQDTSTKSLQPRFKLHYQHIWHFHHAQDTVPYKRPIYLASKHLPWRLHFTAATPAQPWAEQEPHGSTYSNAPT